MFFITWKNKSIIAPWKYYFCIWDWKWSFTYSKCPNSIQLVVFCSRAISEYTCGPQQPLYHPSFYCISLSLSPPLSPWYWDMQPNTSSKMLTCPILLTETPVSTDAVSSKYKWKSFPTAGSDPGSFQSKSEHASQISMMNPQTIREKNLHK